MNQPPEEIDGRSHVGGLLAGDDTCASQHDIVPFGSVDQMMEARVGLAPTMCFRSRGCNPGPSLLGSPRHLSTNSSVDSLTITPSQRNSSLVPKSRFELDLSHPQCDVLTANTISGWRRRRDSNPRSPCGLTAFPRQRIRPLCHVSMFDQTGQRNAWESNPVDPCGSYGLANRCITILPAFRWPVSSISSLRLPSGK